MLSSLLVIEVAGSVAGGYAAKLLADHGATVRKVLIPGRPRSAVTDGMALYLDGDKTIEADPGEIGVAGLVASADIVIESSSPDPLVSILDHLADDARRISVQISPYGSSGPLAGRRSTDLTDQAVSGHLYLNGDPDREPLRGPEHQVAYAAGTHAAIGALAAVRARLTTGRGQRVQVSHQQVMTALHQFTLLRHTHNGDILRRMGNRYAGPGHPIGVYHCADGLITLVVPRGDQLETLLSITGLDHLLEHPEIDGIYELMHHPTLVDEHLVAWLATRQTEETIELFQAARIPAGAVATMDDVLADTHLAARGGWRSQAVAGRQIRTPGRVARLSRWSTSDSPAGGPTRPGPSAGLEDGPLAGLRVLDLTRVWAGPYGTRILADLGADVIMVEAPWARGGATIDDISVTATRYYPDNQPGERHWNRIGFANKYNINKRNVALDLRSEVGVRVLEALIAEADVLIENYSPRVMPNFGLDEARLGLLNPGLIYVTMPGFGRTGPLRDHVAYGPIIDSQAGLSVLMGYPGEHARKAGVAWPDPVAGMHAAHATLVAILERAEDGAGRTVEVAQIEAAVAMVGHALADRQLTGRAAEPAGNRDSQWAPSGVYPCAGDDRWVAVSVLDDEGWRELCMVAGFDAAWLAWSFDDRRLANAEIDRAMIAWTGAADQERLVAVLQGVGIAAAAVADAGQVLADPQLAAADFFVELDHPEAGRHRWPRLAVELSETPATYRRPGPNLNQHGFEVLTEVAGLEADEVAALVAARVVADTPPD